MSRSRSKTGLRGLALGAMRQQQVDALWVAAVEGGTHASCYRPRVQPASSLPGGTDEAGRADLLGAAGSALALARGLVLAGGFGLALLARGRPVLREEEPRRRPECAAARLRRPKGP